MKDRTIIYGERQLIPLSLKAIDETQEQPNAGKNNLGLRPQHYQKRMTKEVMLQDVIYHRVEEQTQVTWEDHLTWDKAGILHIGKKII